MSKEQLEPGDIVSRLPGRIPGVRELVAVVMRNGPHEDLIVGYLGMHEAIVEREDFVEFVGNMSQLKPTLGQTGLTPREWE